MCNESCGQKGLSATERNCGFQRTQWSFRVCRCEAADHRSGEEASSLAHVLPSLIGESSVQLLSHVQLFVTPWTAALQASLSITNSRNSLTLMSMESVMPSSHLILCRPLLLQPSIFPSGFTKIRKPHCSSTSGDLTNTS